MIRRLRYIGFLIALLLTVGGIINRAWAYKVNYYILTLPLDHEAGTKNTKEIYDGKRIAAIKAIDAEGTEVGLDEHLGHFKSPLAQNFAYYDPSFITDEGKQAIYPNHGTKYPLFSAPTSPYKKVTLSGGSITEVDCTAEDWTTNPADDDHRKKTPTATEYADAKAALSEDGDYYFKLCLDEGSTITANCTIYVTYEYNASNTIAKLDGSESYNIEIGGGFVAFNKGRNNRMAVIPVKFSNGTERISGEQLSSEEFVKVDVSGTAISPWWNGNLTPKNRIYSYFHFLFKYEGEDPYNITIRSAYEDGADYYIELYGSSDTYSVNKLYKGSSLFAYRKSTENSDELLLASDDNVKYKTANDNRDYTSTVEYDEKPGFYRSLGGAIWNSFAMLNNSTGTGYVFMGTKCVKSDGTFEIPSDNKKDGDNYMYYYLNINDKNKLYYTLQTATTASNTSSSEEEMYEVYEYTFKVKTPFGNTIQAKKRWSEAYGNQALLDHIPDTLKRKYVTFEGAYKTDDLDGVANNTLATFEDADGNSREIWLKYSVDDEIPFDALPADGSYTDARWYTIRMNGDHETQYIAYRDESGNFFTGRGSNSDLHQGENSLEAQVAFMGDPFELRIISHEASELVEPTPADRYIGCPSGTDAQTIFSAVTSSDICSWEIIDDEEDGSFKLRQYGTYADPWYFGWNYGASNNPIIYTQTAASYIKVVEMEKKTYVYHIYNSAGSIAVKASANQDVGIPLKYTNIPEIIRSPLISPGYATLNFYSDAACTNEIIHAPFNVTADANKDIYVKYTITGSMPTGNYHVRLNVKYIYYDSGSGNIFSSDEPVTDNANPLKDYYIWHLDITDPYAMIINNTGITADDKYVKVDSWNDKAALGWDVLANASKFIVKSNGGENYEVMATTGDLVDASTTYYNIGRTDDEGVLMYGKSSYPHTYPQIRFVLSPIDASAVDFHLIDKAGKELLVVRRRTNDLYFPDQYRSPLVSTYYYWTSAACNVALASVATATDEGGVKQVYVTYETNSLVNLRKGQLYLLKFHIGDSFRQENGADGLTTSAVQAVYPYCNGDCNFFMYGEDEYELQQQGAASTRTRWAWYLESANNDPYHVKICSRQLETFNGYDNQAYFHTFVQRWDDEDHVVTSLAWPGITGVQGTEYMVLGTITDEIRNFQLVTTPVDNNGDGDYLDDGEHPFYVVKAFEQYWKTYDTVKNKLLKDVLDEEDKGVNIDGETTVPDKSKYRDMLTGTGSGQYGFHSYSHWAYAKRFNGYNKDGETKKGWEQIEHWYQTVNMGEGYFDFVSTVIAPVLILLDQHGWEIMRKPLPYSDQDPKKEQKKDVIRAYDSPMVKEYYYWSSAKKRTGFHQYYQLEKRIGGSYTSTSLGDLPPWGSENVLDAKGNQNDEYVTYTVKDEYVQSYNPSTQAGSQFLIQQGNKYASATNATTIGTTSVLSPGGMSQYIINNAGSIGNSVLWILKPNVNIDYEMGYVDASETTTLNHDWTNDYTGNFSDGFDPYNIQISSSAFTDSYFYTNATGATLTEGDGAVLGTYAEAPKMALGPKPATVNGTWYDSRILKITNATFMAVEDKEGNMQLMPRFDQANRVRDLDTLVTPTAEAGDPTKLTETYTKLFRPIVYNYHIIDNQGRESLRYRSGGDLTPQTPDHFKSPLAKDFKYYKTLTSTGTNTYDLATLADEITESLAGKGLTSTAAVGNEVYVRYNYNDSADVELILKGKWFTMELNNKDVQYTTVSETAGIYADADTPTKPTPIDGNAKSWQWKFLETPHTDPDPYAVCLFNRYYNGQSTEFKSQYLFDKRFALLPHTGYSEDNRVYALAEAGTANTNYDTYNFLNGSTMSSSVPATIVRENGFLSTSCSFHETDSKIKLTDEVTHTYRYKVYTYANDQAIEGDQTFGEASGNEFRPVLPDAIKSPLLNDEDFRYYYTNSYFSNPKISVTEAMKEKYPEMKGVSEIPDTIGKGLQYMYGLYDDVVYVHYLPYNPDNSTYKVPNDKDVDGEGHVIRGSESNDASLELNGNLIYNIIWYNDEMMKSNGSSIESTSGQNLQAVSAYQWKITGNDPYAFNLVNMSNKYVYSSNNSTCSLDDNASSFMLLPQEGYYYGVLAMMGNKRYKLSGHGHLIADADAATPESPTKFVIFALSTHKVIYHLVIAPTATNKETPESGCYETIDYFDESTGVLTTKNIPGSTQRDLSSVNDVGGVPGEKYQLGKSLKEIDAEATRDLLYCYDAGHISLGDKLTVPSAFYRPNVVYDYYVEGIYSDEACTILAYSTDLTPVSLNSKYKGKKVDHMGDDADLLGKTVLINIVYTFNGSLETNAGADFVRSVSQNKWYTFEAKKADGTPQLMQFTNAWGMEVKEGHGTHYTNDYLWTPLGDPYGFKMYHRYTCVNSGEWNNGEPNRVMTTADFTENQEVWMDDGKTGVTKMDSATAAQNSIYELLEGYTPGYFKIHPVANNSGTQYNLKIVRAHEDNNPSKPEHDYVKLSSEGYTEFTYGLTEELVKPYYDRAGYVGGLNAAGKAAYEAATNLMEKQAAVYDPDHIVHYTPGYYRLHSPEDIEGVTVRYASGYTHKTELTGGAGSTPIPMHFYEVEGSSSAFNLLKSKDGASVDAGYTTSVATRGDIPIPAVEYDPASIFYCSQVPTDLSSFTTEVATSYHNNANMAILSTQGLYLKCTNGPGNTETSPSDTAKAVMTETMRDATPLYIMDIGGGILLIHDQQTATGRVNLKYLSYDQADADHIYDLKLTHKTHTDHAKWLMQPANHLGLRITTHSGGDAGTYGLSYNYTTFYAPFDIMLPDTVFNKENPEQIDKIYQATICESACSPWSPPGDLHPKSIGRYNTEANGCPDGYETDEKGVDHYFRGNDRFIPAGTPVLIAMLDNSGYVKVTLPTNSPHPMTSPFTSSKDEKTLAGETISKTTARTNILTGQYLEQLLPFAVNPPAVSSHRIYTFGIPIETTSISLNASTGVVTAELPSQANVGMGFYLNANPNKENGLSRGEWTRNNWYVYSNKVYYHSTGGGGGAPDHMRDVQYVPVIFGDGDEGDEDPKEEEEDMTKRRDYVGDNCVYDLLGRKVASANEVKAGTWYRHLQPGIYILNGHKIYVGVGWM